MIAPVPPDTEHTTVKLVRALRAVPDPGVSESMIARAARGYYHDYLSPLALPELALIGELRAIANHPSRNGTRSRLVLLDIAQRVIDGEFDASKAESDAWAKSPEGRAAFASLVRLPQPPERP
jgi:hypothetical protein